MLSGAGGICGPYAGKEGTVNISNCYSIGEIKGEAGGICGDMAGSKGTVTITNSYTTGEITGNYSGGICGLGGTSV